tara:strand:- start:12669 stop:13073 length:405 start_codon:yes stop_codon:yes gene_type:complete
MTREIVIDATQATLGRLASYAAKQALLGKKVTIVNCEKAILTGRRKSIIKDYQKKRELGGSALKGPFFPKSPERILKRTVRGMLSYKQARGRTALKNVICHNKIPPELEKTKKITAGKEKHTTILPLLNLSKEI